MYFTKNTNLLKPLQALYEVRFCRLPSIKNSYIQLVLETQKNIYLPCYTCAMSNFNFIIVCDDPRLVWFVIASHRWHDKCR